MTDLFFSLAKIPAITWLAACKRCGALVTPAGRQKHFDWHGAVDTNTTSALPGEPGA